MGLRGNFELVRRHVVALVVCVLAFPALAFVLCATATPSYTSTAELFVSLKNSATASDLAQGATYTRDQMASYATLATTPAVLQPVVDQLGLPDTARQLADRVTATAPDATVVLQVSASDPSPRQAARIADAVATQLIDETAQVAPQDENGRATVRFTQVTPASVPQSASTPKTRLNVALGLLIGIVVGVLYAVVREALDTRVRDTERVESLTDAPVLGAITAAAPAAGGGHLPVADLPHGRQAEMLRQLATNVDFLRAGDGALSLVVTSSLAGEGKSTVATNLALALAEVGHRVVLVDADLRRPAVADRLRIEGAAGLSTVLLGRAEFDDVRQEWGAEGLHVLASGAVPPNPVQLLTSGRMGELMELLTSRYDVVVVDAPPVLPVTDALLLSRHTTGTVLVANSRTVRRAQFAGSVEALARVEARLLGVVVNMLPARGQAAAYGYGAEEGDTAPTGLRRLRALLPGGGRPAAVPAARLAVPTPARVPAPARPQEPAGLAAGGRR